MRGDIETIGALIILGVAAGLIYFMWAVSTDRDVYGHLGRPPRPVALFILGAALVAAIGVAVLFNL